MRPRYLYTLYCLGLPGRFKIGITYNVTDRISQIQYELRRQTGRELHVRVALAVPVLFPERAERWLHRKFEAMRAKMPYHSGHTEWFTIRNGAVALAFLFFLGYNEQTFTVQRAIITLVLFRAPFPLDGVLLQIVVALAHLFAGLFGLYVILYALGAILSV